MYFVKLLLAFLITAAFTCNKTSDLEDKNNQLTLAYAQTHCADPWTTSADDNVTAQNISRYLKSYGIQVVSVRITKTSEGVACLACTCLSGKTIYVTTSNTEAMRTRLAELGFR